MSILADANRKDYQPRHGRAAIERSAALSMANTPKDSAHTRKVAILAAAGVDASAVEIMKRHEPKPKEQPPSSGQSEWTKVHWASDILPVKFRVKVSAEPWWARGRVNISRQVKRRYTMNIFYIIGVVVVVAVILGYLGLR